VAFLRLNTLRVSKANFLTSKWYDEEDEPWTGKGLWQQTAAVWSFGERLSVWNWKADLRQGVLVFEIQRVS